MDELSLFLRIRTIAFSCVNLLSFLWIILYSVVIFSQWDLLVRSEKTLISVMLAANVITLITVLILLIVEFRVWLDFARISFLFITNLGIAIAFAHWSPQFQCGKEVGDQQGVCGMISLSILITSWTVPVLLIAYLVGLAVKLYRCRTGKSSDCSMFNTENAPSSPKASAFSRKPSLLPIMTAIPTPASLTFPPETHTQFRQSMNTRRSTLPVSFRDSPPTSPITPGRLSKRSPLVDWV